MKPFKGGRASKAIIPVIRRYKPKKKEVRIFPRPKTEHEHVKFQGFGDNPMMKTTNENMFKYKRPVFDENLSEKNLPRQIEFHKGNSLLLDRQINVTQPSFMFHSKKKFNGPLSQNILDLTKFTSEQKPPPSNVSKDSKSSTLYRVNAPKTMGFLQNDAASGVGKTSSSSKIRGVVKKDSLIMPTATKLSLNSSNQHDMQRNVHSTNSHTPRKQIRNIPARSQIGGQIISGMGQRTVMRDYSSNPFSETSFRASSQQQRGSFYSNNQDGNFSRMPNLGRMRINQVGSNTMMVHKVISKAQIPKTSYKRNNPIIGLPSSKQKDGSSKQ